jgi:hypothetical protein
MNLRVRRGLVATATGASLVMGGVAIHTAAAWVGADVPTSAPPLTTAELEAQLAAEEAHSVALQAQVDALFAQANQFDSALNAASARVAGDVQRAAQLRAQLAAEQRQLASLKAAAAAAARKAASTPSPTHTTTGASGGSSSGDDGGD